MTSTNTIGTLITNKRGGRHAFDASRINASVVVSDSAHFLEALTRTGNIVAGGELRIEDGNIYLLSNDSQGIIHTGGTGAFGLSSGSVIVVESTAGERDAVNLRANAPGGRIRLDADSGVDIPTTNLRLDTGDIQMTSATAQQIVHTGAAGQGLGVTSVNGPIVLEAGEATPEAVEINTPNGGVLFNTSTSFVVNTGLFAVTGGGDIHLQKTVFVRNALVHLPQNKLQMRDQDETLTPQQVYVGYADELTPVTVNRTLTTPSGADIMNNHITQAGISLELGTTYDFHVDNKRGAANRTLVGGDATVTIQGTAAVGAGEIGVFRVVYTALDGDSAVIFIRTN